MKKHIVTIIRILFLGLFIILLAKGRIMLWLGLFGASLVAALLFGRVYCGYVCPMNTLMVPAEWISKKLKFQTSRTPRWLNNVYFSWIFLVFSVGTMLVFKRRLGINLPILPLWLVISIFVTLRYKPQVFHNLICPFGVLQRIFGRLARWSKKVDPKVCTGCKRCEKSCPSGAIAVIGEDKKAAIDPALCHQCTDCQQVCSVDAIYVGK
ncbi:MAG TPA: 4Fe-4S binding protein [Hydrogenispora sp.]|jgi:ferredoxin-type protein NapH|nr:4Fe-4S binding protein [Hydrogenispora sp.]